MTLLGMIPARHESLQHRLTTDSTEYERVPFEADHEESVLEEWLESNPDGVLEDGRLLIIGRQVPTELGKSIRPPWRGPRGQRGRGRAEAGPHAAGRRSTGA